MSSQVDKVLKIFKSVAQYPSPTSGRIMKGVASTTGVTVVSTWSQRNLERGKTTKFLQTHLIDTSTQKSTYLLPMDISFELLSAYSLSEELRGVVREISFEQNKKKQYLEVWKSQLLWKVYDLSALEVHGDVYTDSDFGTLDWSPCERKLLYVAEKKPPKTEPFYKPKSQDNRENGHGNGKAIKGEEYVFRQDWGEQLEGKHQSVVFVCDLNSDSIKELEGIPPHFTPGQVCWAPDGKGIVGVVWETEPRRLGLIYCTNRRGYIFHLTTDGVFSLLSEENQAVRSPRFSPNGEYLIWLQRPAGGPHHAAHKLMCCKFSTRQVDTVVDIVKQRAPTTGGNPFFGLYCAALPKRCWASDSIRVVLSTPQKCYIVSYVIDIVTKSVTEMQCIDGSQTLLDIQGDYILCSRSSLKQPARLALGKLPSKGNEMTISWIPVTNWQADPLLDSLALHYMVISHEEDSDKSSNTFTAIYFGPESSQNSEVPLIVWPHGGPHSAFMNEFSVCAAFFGLLGFGMLMVNYRGSIGAGQDNVEFLLGRIGDTDVKDVHLATVEALKDFSFLNPKKMVLFGGSHGGFLVTHLSGQYPDLYKAVVARNPVIDVAAMATVTDIPDWNAFEAGYSYTEKEEMSSEAFQAMKKCSPISHVSKVIAPTLLLIGSKDKRVPSSQGIHYYYRLKSQNVKTKMMMYEDNHPLGQVPVEMDNLINSALWFYQHIE